MDIVAEVKNITKIYDKKIMAVNQVSFDVYEGEVLGLVGPNGSGKTSTLKLMLGLIKLTEGSISINGFDIKKDFEKAIVNVGSIIETPRHYDYLSGYDNLMLCKRMYENVSTDDAKRMLEYVGLKDRINDKVKKYSLGMKQRLAIAQAMLYSPKLLILDEPMNGLDPEGIKDLREMITFIAKEKKTAVIISSHILNEVELISDRIAFIKEGKLLSLVSKADVNGTLEEMYDDIMSQ